jgi:hypothetical protein
MLLFLFSLVIVTGKVQASRFCFSTWSEETMLQETVIGLYQTIMFGIGSEWTIFNY